MQVVVNNGAYRFIVKHGPVFNIFVDWKRAVAFRDQHHKPQTHYRAIYMTPYGVVIGTDYFHLKELWEQTTDTPFFGGSYHSFNALEPFSEEVSETQPFCGVAVDPQTGQMELLYERCTHEVINLN